MTNWVERLLGETQAKMLQLLRRSRQTINDLAQSLGLTDNAVRTHVAALARDGIIEPVGTQRDTGGKPARLYALTGAGEELFPKAYAMVLAGLVEEIASQYGRERADELLRAVGARTGAKVAAPAGLPDRVEAAAAALRSMGGDVLVQRTDSGWRLQGFACPLASVTAAEPQVCALAQSLVQEITGRPVTECCDRSGRPRCGFLVDEG